MPNELALERICKKDIEAHLGRTVEGDLEFMYSEGCVNTTNIRLFHDIAQSFRQKTLQLNDRKGLLFVIGVLRPNEGSTGDIWRVNLASAKTREFLEKYKQNYKILPVGDNYYFTDPSSGVELSFKRDPPFSRN